MIHPFRLEHLTSSEQKWGNFSFFNLPLSDSIANVSICCVHFAWILLLPSKSEESFLILGRKIKTFPCRIRTEVLFLQFVTIVIHSDEIWLFELKRIKCTYRHEHRLTDSLRLIVFFFDRSLQVFWNSTSILICSDRKKKILNRNLLCTHHHHHYCYTCFAQTIFSFFFPQPQIFASIFVGCQLDVGTTKFPSLIHTLLTVQVRWSMQQQVTKNTANEKWFLLNSTNNKQ